MKSEELKLIAHTYNGIGITERLNVNALILNKDYFDLREINQKNIDELIIEAQTYNSLEYCVKGIGYLGCIGNFRQKKIGLIDDRHTHPIIMLELNGEVIWKKTNLVTVDDKFIIINTEKEKTASILGGCEIEDFKGIGTPEQHILMHIFYYYLKGYTTYLCRLYEGFDLVAAEAIIQFREIFPDVNLICLLPHKEWSKGYTKENKERVDKIIIKANAVVRGNVRNSQNMENTFRHLLISNSSLVLTYHNPSKKNLETFLAKQSHRLVSNLFINNDEDIEIDDEDLSMSNESASYFVKEYLENKYRGIEITEFDEEEDCGRYKEEYESESLKLYDIYQSILLRLLSTEFTNVVVSFLPLVNKVVKQLSEDENFDKLLKEHDATGESKTIENLIKSLIDYQISGHLLSTIVNIVLDSIISIITDPVGECE